ncbi:uncharacterized protein PAC_14080 [Phialocephala subalpina]|uniref:Uncharacterized protein n=1 Tax=Phialocephala subalpina TaxID=576137 RepID=A0A1L7XGL4_9HELO|nr:uncharacterized protein PAC_14080 [Phialocephala subalpina]
MSDTLNHKDIRSAGLGFKRDKEHNHKWSSGSRPGPGVRLHYMDDELTWLPSEGQREKVRPMKQWGLPFVLSSCHAVFITDILVRSKSHANKVPKPHGHYCQARLAHKADALVDANDHASSALSKSLLELLPQHVNNTNSAIQTAIRSTTDADILYSFDNKGPSPGVAGRKVDLGNLVEIAEQKWVAEQTEKIIKGEYEVLDNYGETTVLASKNKNKSPKQKATILKNEPSTVKSLVDDGEDFELI